ncbi:hypothetical protein ACVWYG_000444 [Pedobacter sp. UYEF25]
MSKNDIIKIFTLQNRITLSFGSSARMAYSVYTGFIFE